MLTACSEAVVHACTQQERESQMDGLELPEHDILGGGDDFKR
jgi:hypothetical protein